MQAWPLEEDNFTEEMHLRFSLEPAWSLAVGWWWPLGVFFPGKAKIWGIQMLAALGGSHWGVCEWGLSSGAGLGGMSAVRKRQ